MRHDPWNGNLYGALNIGRYTLVQGFCLYWLFLMEGKGLTLPYLVLGLLSIIVLQQLIDSTCIVESVSLQLDVPNKMFHCTKGCLN